MIDYEEILNKPIAIDTNTMGRLSLSEVELTRMDERISNHALRDAIRHQLLRVEAITSVRIDGSDVGYAELARFEFSLDNAPLAHQSPRSLFKRADKIGVKNAEGVVRAIHYMGAITWISQNVTAKSRLGADVFQQIYDRYNENEIERAAARYAGGRGADVSSPISATRRPSGVLRDADEHAYIDFLNSERFSPCAQAEISHALLQNMGLDQYREDGFERAFSHVIFYRRGVLTRSIAPLAVGPFMNIEKHANAIYENMSTLSQGDGSDGMLACSFEDSAFCASLPARVMQIATKTLELLYASWKSRLGLAGASEKKTALMLLRQFLDSDYLTIDLASKRLSRSFSTVSAAMQSLESAGIVRNVEVMNRRRVFCAPELVDAFELLVERVSPKVKLTRDEALARLEQASRPEPL